MLGGAGILAGAALLGQSRGWLIVLPLTAVVALVAVPGRGRTIAAFGAVGVALALIRNPVLDVYSTFKPFRPPGDDYDAALRAILLAGVGLAVVGTLAAIADRRIRLSEERARRISAATVVALGVAIVLALVGYAAVERSPISAFNDDWNEFKQGGRSPTGTQSRLSSGFSTYRYDYWTVAWSEFKRAPIAGAGADNFGRAYLLHGKSPQTPLYPHSTEMVALSETGLIGTFLLGGAFLAALLAAARAARRNELAGVAAGAGILMFGYWFLHSSLDWLWEFPGLAGAALGVLGIGGAIARGLERPDPLAEESGRPLLAARPALALAILAALALTVSIVPSWFGERELRRGTELAATDPTAAIDHFERAADWNPLTAIPYKAAGIVEVRRGRDKQAARQLRRGLERDPGDSGLWVYLGAIESAAGDKQLALRYVGRATQLAPRDHEVAAHALYDLHHYGGITPKKLDSYAQADLEDRAGRD
jgi:O-antigen ligase